MKPLSISLLLSASMAMSMVMASCAGSGVLEPRYVAVHNTLNALGYAQTGTISEGSLPQGSFASFEVELQGGECYAFVALGAGIDDIDVQVMLDDETLAQDVTHDAQAAARACPDTSGTYSLVVTAAEGSGEYIVTSWSGVTAVSSSGGSMVASGGGTCGDPVTLTMGQPFSGSTMGAPSSLSTPCAEGSSPERIHRLVIPQRTQVEINLESSYDGTLYVLSECGNIGSSIDCNDDSPDTQHSALNLTLEEGTYFVVVDGYADGNQGDYTLVVTETVLQDLTTVCAAATPLTPGVPATGTTSGRVDYFQATCAGGSWGPDQVFSISVPQRSRLRVRQQSDHDGALYVRTMCDQSATELSCNDDFVDTRHSLVTQFVDPGTYFIYADGFGGRGSNESGNFTLTADIAPAAGGNAPGDTCQSALPLPTNAFVVDTLQASDDLAGSCGGQGAADVVYSLSITSRSRVTIDLTESEFAGALYIRRACDNAGSEVYCASISQGQQASGTPSPTGVTPFQTELDPGQYFIVVDGQRPESFGSAQMNVTVMDLAAQRRLCQRAPLLRPGRTTSDTTAGQGDNFQASCAGGARSEDRMYRLRIRRRSDVRLSLSATYDAALYIRRDCGLSSSELACNDDTGDSNHSRIVTTLDPGTYFVFVDGFSNGNQGTFNLELEVGRPGSFPAQAGPPQPQPAQPVLPGSPFPPTP